MFKLLKKTLGSANAEPLSPVNIKCSFAIIQADQNNQGGIEVGDDTLLAGNGILIIPFFMFGYDRIELRAYGVGNNLDLNQIYAVGTTGESVNVLYEVF
jgi:hypothetical protein